MNFKSIASKLAAVGTATFVAADCALAQSAPAGVDYTTLVPDTTALTGVQKSVAIVVIGLGVGYMVVRVIRHFIK